MELVVQNKNIQINLLQTRVRGVKPNAIKTFKLLTYCINHMIVLDGDYLASWYLKNIASKEKYNSRHGIWRTYESGQREYVYLSEFEYYSEYFEKNKNFPYWYISKANQFLKMQIGILVVSGALMALPVIKLDELEANQIINK